MEYAQRPHAYLAAPKTHMAPGKTHFNYPWITLFVSIQIIHAYI